MAIVGTLDIPVRGDVRNIEEALGRTQTRVKQFADSATFDLLRVSSHTFGMAGAFQNSASILGSSIASVFGRLPGFKAVGDGLTAFLYNLAPITQNAERAFTRFGQKTTEVATTAVAGFGAMRAGLIGLAVAAASALAETASGVAGAIQSLDQMARYSERLGVTVKQFAALRLQAGQLGIGVEEVSRYFAHFQRNISEAWAGSEKAAISFARLRLDIDKMKDMTPIERWKRMQDALRDFGGSEDKIMLVDHMLGSMGRSVADRLLPALLQGGDAFDALVEKAARLGPTTSGAVEAVRKVAVAWRDFKMAITGITESLSVALAPVLQRVAGWFVSLAERIAAFWSNPENLAFFQKLAVTVMDLGEAIIFTLNPFYQAYNALSIFLGGLGESKDHWTAFRDMGVKALVGIELALTWLKNGFTLAWNYIALKMAEVINSIGAALDRLHGMEVTPIIRTDKWKGEIDRLLKSGFPSFDALMAKYLDGLKALTAPDKIKPPGDDIGGNAVKGPASMVLGSKEAFGVLFGKEEYQQATLDVNKEMLEVLKTQQKTLDKWLQNLTGDKKAAFEIRIAE